MLCRMVLLIWKVCNACNQCKRQAKIFATKLCTKWYLPFNCACVCAHVFILLWKTGVFIIPLFAFSLANACIGLHVWSIFNGCFETVRIERKCTTTSTFHIKHVGSRLNALPDLTMKFRLLSIATIWLGGRKEISNHCHIIRRYIHM